MVENEFGKNVFSRIRLKQGLNLQSLLIIIDSDTNQSTQFSGIT